MKEELKTGELREAVHEIYRQLQNMLERKQEEAGELETQLRVIEATQGLLDEIDRLNAVNRQADEVV